MCTLKYYLFLYSIRVASKCTNSPIKNVVRLSKYFWQCLKCDHPPLVLTYVDELYVSHHFKDCNKWALRPSVKIE